VDRVAEALGLSGRAAEAGKETLRALWRMFRATDATLIEVNPLAETPDGKVVVADAKINFDDNAAFRQAVSAPGKHGRVVVVVGAWPPCER
jgi:succinyl-CoA synthetase beta subunit